MLKIEQLTKTLMVAACGVSALQLAAVEAEQVAKDTVPRHMVASQETESQAEALVRKANDLFVNGKFDEARETYLDAKIIFQKFNSQIFADKVRFCDDRVKECYFQKARAYFDAAQKKANDENFDKAIEYYNEALKCYPECEAEVRPLIQQLEKRKAASALRRSVSTETLIPERGNQLYQIQVLLRQGQEFVKIGEFDKAVQKYNEILLIDPYNAEAIHNLKAANIRSSKVARERYKNTHHKMAAEIEWKWARNISYEGSAAAENQVDAPIEKEAANDFGDISQKLRSIIIPRIDFDDITVPAALRFLQTESKRNDPEQKGVNIFLRRPPVLDAQQNMGMDPAMDPGMDPMLDPTLAPDPAMAADPAQDPGAAVTDPNAPATQDIMERRVSMTSTKMSLYDVLQLLCKEMKLRMRIDRHAVVLAPENVALDDLETKVFPLDKSVFSDFDPEKENAKLVDFFKNYGVQFPQGAKIVYDARLSRLIAYNTLDNLREIDSAIQEIQNENEPMVEITAKFIEVSQNDLKEMGFDYSVSYNAANKPESNSSYSSHRLSFDNSLSGLLRHYNEDPMINVGGYMNGADGFVYGISVHAANQMDSADTLASPRITTLPDVTAHIEMVREVPFVDEYDESEFERETDSSDNGTSVGTWTYIGPFPNFEDPDKLGIMMDIMPQVDKERRTITVQMAPRIRSFVEYTSYTSTDSDGNEELMRKPVIAERTIDTTVTVYDGETIVLGGVVEDNTSTLNDKIPIFGDLPLVGRFFQSRYNHAEKRQLLIFMTCRLVKPDGMPFFPAEKVNRGLPQNDGLLN